MESEGIGAFLNPTVLIGLFAGGSIVLLMYILKLMRTENKNTDDIQTKHVKELEQLQQTRKDPGQTGKGNKKKGADKLWASRSDKQAYSHPWLLTSLKGHTGQVLDMDFSSNGKYLASCADDRTVLLWDIKDLSQKEHRSLRTNIEFDHPTFVKWSPDSKAFIISKFGDNAVEVYKIEKKKDSWLGQAIKAYTFPKIQTDDVIGVGIACNGKYIMTCTNKTDLVIWDLKGQILSRVDTYLMNTFCAKISPCGKFIVASGFAPDVKVWEVIFNKAGEFQEVKRAFELSGHTSGVYDIAFDADSSHIATVSKDGTWKVFDTKIEYKKGEDPHLKITGKYEQASTPALIALSPNAEVVVISSFDSLAFYSVHNGELDYVIENVYSGRITSIKFDSLGKYVLTSGEKHIRVFQNVTGHRCGIVSAKEKLKQHQTSATKERIEKLIRDSEAFLKTVEAKA